MNKMMDPFALEVLWARLIAITDEAATALVRTSFSTIVRESKDFACVLMDAQGRSLAQNTSTVPSFVGTLPRTMKHFLSRFPADEWQPGDVVATNDPWLATGHKPDITLVAPIFHRGRLVAFAGAIAHMPDIGGRIYSADTTDLYEEGLSIPPCRLYESGVPNALLIEIIRSNVRVPDQTLGDIRAQISACNVMGRRIEEMMEEQGLDALSDVASAIHERSARAMRAAVAAVPDGTYRASVDTDEIDGQSLHIEVAVTISGETVHCDYSGTSAQVQRGINAVYNCTFAHTAYYLKCVLDPDLPNNEGALSPLTVTVPEGTILNPTCPAPVNARQIILHYLHAVMFGALAQAVPNKVIAQCGAPSNRSMFSGTKDDGTSFSLLMFTSGGMGARYNKDGLPCTTFPTNSGAASIEVMESSSPILVRRKELRPDSGGLGEFRGGLGQMIEVEILSNTPVTVSFLMDRIQHPADGLNGGGAGAPASLRLLNRTMELPPKGRAVLHKGDVIEIGCAGGGGFGPLSQRLPALVTRDRAHGYVTT